MARLPRFILPGQPQHVIQRGNNRQPIFCANKDYTFYLEKLLYAATEHKCQIHAYVQMTNHVHLLVTPLQEDSLSRMMQTLGRYYVPYFNYTYRRTGTLWEGRYKATLINSDNYLFTCMRYIELNPVRAKMVLNPSEYPWSSYHHNALGMTDPLIYPHANYDALGNTTESRQNHYLELCKIPIDKKTLLNIQEATNKAWILGDDVFQQAISRELGRRVQPHAKGGDRKSKKFQETLTIHGL